MFAFRHLLLLALVLGFGLISAPSVRSQDKGVEIKKLLKERSDLLEEALRVLVPQYEEGVADLTELLRARREALQAKLDLQGSPKERIAVLRKSVEVAGRIVKIVDDRKKVGVAKNVDLIRAKAGHLEVRIELLREEQKLEAEKKRNK